MGLTDVSLLTFDHTVAIVHAFSPPTQRDPLLPRPLKYARPASLAEATRLLGEHPGARALAGGQSLVNVLKLRAAEVDALIDISRLEELRVVRVLDGGDLEIG